MKFVIQRVSKASVSIDGNVVGAIDKGYMVLIGIGKEDTTKEADRLVDKMLKMRIFDDEEGKTNLSLADVNGSLLLISQFTLYADCRKGNRPSFINAAPPAEAESLYEYIISKCKEQVQNVQTGSFGADMKVELTNNGPFTIILDSAIFA
jgi:D-tyrosyl-tRNA(Tyr) deacylase